jgi:hypothetical protein
VKGKYERALKMDKDDSEFKDMNLYKPEEIHKYGPEFLAYIDPGFV